MKQEENNPYEALERIFHEPSRLAIMSALCASERALSFNELKETCRLTDGNLNRHLKVLVDAQAVKIKKTFVGAKPRTTVYLSKGGVRRFNEYIEALSTVLARARDAMPKEQRSTSLPWGEPARA
jgi:DNA-binding transcriptional ArsR family regulator